MEVSILRFVAACFAAGIGVMHLMPFLQLLDMRVKRKALSTDVPGAEDNFLRSNFMGSGLLGLWVGSGLAVTAGMPAAPASVLEMGWAYLIALTIGSALFFKREWRAKWVLALGVVGCSVLFCSG